MVEETSEAKEEAEGPLDQENDQNKGSKGETDNAVSDSGSETDKSDLDIDQSQEDQIDKLSEAEKSEDDAASNEVKDAKELSAEEEGSSVINESEKDLGIATELGEKNAEDQGLNQVKGSNEGNESNRSRELKLEEEKKNETLKKTKTKRLAVLIGIGGVALIVGIAAGVAFWVFGDDSNKVVQTEEDKSKVLTVKVPLPPRGEKSSKKISKKAKKSPERGGASLSSERAAQTSNEPINKNSTQPPSDALRALGVGGLGRSTPSGGGLVVPSVTVVSYKRIPNAKKVEPLSKAPVKKLEMKVAGISGVIPKIGDDGREPRLVYARPNLSKGKNPTVAIIVKGLGFSRTATQAAIKKLPGDVSLAFSPYASKLNDWLMRARLAGHEVFLELPMESKKFPLEDPGPLALSSNFQLADNIKQLHRVMSKMGGYVGLLSTMGSKFIEAEAQLKPILLEVKKQGLMYIDGGRTGQVATRIAAEIKLPKAFVNITLDTPPDEKSFKKKLRSLEGGLKKWSRAVATMHASPKSIERIKNWIKSLDEKKIKLVPVSAMTDKQPIE